MSKVIIISQASQAISLVRTLFALNFKPSNIIVFTDENEKTVGGTLHNMTNKIDAGKIIHQFKITIKKNDIAFTLHHKIFNKSLSCLKIILELINSNYEGKPHSGGVFHKSKFPDISNLNVDLLQRINFSPPNFTKI